jgi:nickel-type superoxide dismutase maturation protease
MRRTGRQSSSGIGSVILAGSVLACVAGFLIVRPRRVQVTGPSMEPTLHAGDRLLVGRTGPSKVGDVVALRDPSSPRHIIVKRITAVRRVEVLVLGDNAEASVDSRSFGPVPKSALLGKVLRRYAPPDRAGRVV